jgi:hypothetical protein
MRDGPRARTIGAGRFRTGDQAMTEPLRWYLQNIHVRAAVAIGFVLAVGGAANAQVGYLWTMAELEAKADLVVIAELRDTTDTGRRMNHPELRPAFPVIEMQSEFEILAVLKATAPDTSLPSAVGTRVRVMYYRHDMDQWRRDHPPEPGLPPPGVVNTGSSLNFTAGEGPYLLFLAKGSNGLYEPLSGHTFPTDSVYLLRELGRRGG